MEAKIFFVSGLEIRQKNLSSKRINQLNVFLNLMLAGFLCLENSQLRLVDLSTTIISNMQEELYIKILFKALTLHVLSRDYNIIILKFSYV